jgi:WD40 repeat protein
VWGAVFTPDGQRLVTVGNDLTVRTWDAKERDELISLDGLKGRNAQVSFAARGPRIATSVTYGERPDAPFRGIAVQVWDTSGRQLRALEKRYSFDPNQAGGMAELSADGRLVGLSWGISRMEEGKPRIESQLQIWDVGTGSSIFQLSEENWFSRMALSPDGALVAACYMPKENATEGKGGEIRIWEVATGRKLRTIADFPPVIMLGSGLSFSPDGRLLALHGEGIVDRPTDSNTVIRVWEVATGKELPAPEQTGPTQSRQNLNHPVVAFSPDGRLIAWPAMDVNTGTTIPLYDVASGRHLRTLKGQPSGVVNLSFSNNGRRLLSIAQGLVKLWDTETGNLLLDLRGEDLGSLVSADFSDDGQSILAVATLADGYALKVWNAKPRSLDR